MIQNYDNEKMISSTNEDIVKKLDELENESIILENILDQIAKSSMIDKSIFEIKEEISHIERSFRRLNKECYLLEDQYILNILKYLEIQKQEKNCMMTQKDTIDILNNLKIRSFNQIPFEIIDVLKKKKEKLFLKSEKLKSLTRYLHELKNEKILIDETIAFDAKKFIAPKNLVHLELEIYFETLFEDTKIKIIELKELLSGIY